MAGIVLTVVQTIGVFLVYIVLRDRPSCAAQIAFAGMTAALIASGYRYARFLFFFGFLPKTGFANDAEPSRLALAT
jgi:hypothetical protein